MVEVARPPAAFSDWPGLLLLLQGAFAAMEGRIDPPSSVARLTPAALAAKAGDEALFVAMDERELVGCVFAARRHDALYVSKLAVRPDRQGTGIGRCLMQAVERHALAVGVPSLELDTRVELTENHAAFAALGYVRTGEHAHPGYDRPTFVTMRKRLAGAPPADVVPG